MRSASQRRGLSAHLPLPSLNGVNLKTAVEGLAMRWKWPPGLGRERVVAVTETTPKEGNANEVRSGDCPFRQDLSRALPWIARGLEGRGCDVPAGPCACCSGGFAATWAAGGALGRYPSLREHLGWSLEPGAKLGLARDDRRSAPWAMGFGPCLSASPCFCVTRATGCGGRVGQDQDGLLRFPGREFAGRLDRHGPGPGPANACRQRAWARLGSRPWRSRNGLVLGRI